MRRPLAKIACAALVAVLVASAGSPANAEAKMPRAFYGAAFGNSGDLSLLPRASAGGVRTIRMTFYWGFTEPSPGTRNWHNFDTLVRSAASARMRLLPVLVFSPPWISQRPSRPPIYSPYARAAWKQLLTDVAARYGKRGSFWAANPDVPRIPLIHFQIWNEVNLSGFWGGRPKAGNYFRLLKISKRALRRGDRSARVVGAGIIPFKSLGKGAVGGEKYLKQLFKFKKAKKLLDAVAIHPYGRNPKVVMRSLHRIRQLLNRLGVKRKPIWVTEFGWTTGGTGWANAPFKASLKGQARKLNRTLKRMKKARKRLKLKRALYFSLIDMDNPGDDAWPARMGLFDLNRQPKPAWFAFARRAGGHP